jgi:hypothetical protein
MRRNDRKDPRKPKEPRETPPEWPDDPPTHGDEGGGNSFGNPVPRPPAGGAR